MDFDKINSAISRALLQFEEQEAARMSSFLFEEEGVLDLPDQSPGGDPEAGASHGTDNHDSWVDVYMGFIGGILTRCQQMMPDVSEEEAMNYLMDFSDQLAMSGEIPEMPNPDASDEDEVLAWVSAAKNVGFEARLMDYVKGMMPPTA